MASTEQVPLKDMTTEEKRAVLKGLIDEYADTIEREKKIITKIEGELKKKKEIHTIQGSQIEEL